MLSGNFKDNEFAFILIMPAFIFITALTIYPLLQAIWLSLHKYNLVEVVFEGKPFIGLSNYFQIIKDERFWFTLKNTALFVGVTVFFQTVFGFIIALIANYKFKARGLVRAAILLPWALPTSINAMIWKWLFNAEYGFFNDIFLRLGIISEKITWLADVETAMPSIMSTAVWKVSSFMGLLILAGLQSIPEEIYESAKIDGATKFQQFWNITFPLVKPALMVALIFRTRDAFRVFDLIYVLTGGGPGNSTESIAIYTYKTTFSNLSFGYGSSLAIIMFLISLLISYIYFRVLRKEGDL